MPSTDVAGSVTSVCAYASSRLPSARVVTGICGSVRRAVAATTSPIGRLCDRHQVPISDPWPEVGTQIHHEPDSLSRRFKNP
jgi:hypothetical protein